MKYTAIFCALLAFCAIFQMTVAMPFSCKDPCRKRFACGYDAERDCYRVFQNECLFKQAVCVEGAKLQRVIITECTSAFDYCDT